MTRLRAAACLSLTGRFAQFGVQAGYGLRMWADRAGVDLAVADDESDPGVLAARLPELAQQADLLFGPYSTVLTRTAIQVADEAGMLLFNHGGSGGTLDLPGRVVNVLTPAGRYAQPFVDLLASQGTTRLFTTRGRGAFGRDVISGALDAAPYAGIHTAPLEFDRPPRGVWALMSAGVYEDDVAAVNAALALPNPPTNVCSVAAGVASFAQDCDAPEGVYGVGQWALGTGIRVDAEMTEQQFLTAWRDRHGGAPDYPGVQAYAAGAIASAAVLAAGTTDRAALWRAVAHIDLATVFGRFRIDPATGAQTGHDSVLTRWHNGKQITIM